MVLLGLVAIIGGVMLLLAVTGHLHVPGGGDDLQGMISQGIRSNIAAGIPLRQAGTWTGPEGSGCNVTFAVTDVTPRQPGYSMDEELADLSAQLRHND